MGVGLLPEQQQHLGCHVHDSAVLLLPIFHGLICQAGLALAMYAF
jgi:hypothetical protein